MHFFLTLYVHLETTHQFVASVLSTPLGVYGVKSEHKTPLRASLCHTNRFGALKKLEGVAPLIADHPPTSFTKLSKKRRRKKGRKKEEKSDMSLWTHDTWHVTCDTVTTVKESKFALPLPLQHGYIYTWMARLLLRFWSKLWINSLVTHL